jgi:hypothetical protein
VLAKEKKKEILRIKYNYFADKCFCTSLIPRHLKVAFSTDFTPLHKKESLPTKVIRKVRQLGGKKSQFRHNSASNA